MRVEDSVGAPWLQFGAALEEAWVQATPLLIAGREWRLTIAEGHPLVRVLIGDRRWLLLLHCDRWSRGRKIAAERIAGGEAVAKELRLYRRPELGRRQDNCPNSDQMLSYEIVCRMVAWLPRKSVADPARRRRVPRQRVAKADPRVRSQHIEEIAIA